MIYVTGDFHGDIERFKDHKLKKLKKGDTLIICGDFGFLWDGSKKEKQTLKWIGKRPYQVLFVDGTHDNQDLLKSYEPEEFCGGKARRISGGLWHLMRGNVYTIEDRKIFAFGGGETRDTDIYEHSDYWWFDELPTVDEIDYARSCLQKHDNQIDYIVTHDAPGVIKAFINMDDNHFNHLHTFFDEVNKNCDFKMWFFGLYHMDKKIPPSHTALFWKVYPLA
ncbi:metallophosphoesterase [Candidatus Soleaferrea massiliensis]|uniref:metallophosphoesterase n=1 Tax=Candidatus Soleaferrea massiliensis TaxID=1470354 RepID=UPI00059053C8|nr:metallophosphoesterase [Candidatus Soleaferrea massiliensis]